jgi:pre-mRNA-splicing factor CWC22
MELFNENLLRGRGLLSKAIVKAQTASPTFTHVYACLVACINTKLPDVTRLLLHRVLD